MLENYMAIIMGVALLGMILDLLCSSFPNMQRQLYKFFFVVIYFLLIIRYYYGPDISSYVPHYERIPSPAELWAHPECASFEWGYDMFCSLLHAAGLSYWWMTVVITTLYFTAIACLFHSLSKYRLFAFAALILLDYNLFFENRQSLAVAMFIFMVLCMQKSRYVLAIVCAALTILMHKSGFLLVGLTWIGALLYRQRQSALVYNILLLVLMVMMLIPVAHIATPLISWLPLPETYIDSISHHLELGRQFQSVALIYFAILIWISMYNAHGHKTYGWIALEVLIGAVIIVAFYQYYFLLNRLRSYVAPFVLFYLANMAIESEGERKFSGAALVRQGVAVLMVLYGMRTTVSYVQEVKKFHSPIARTSTIFDLRHMSSEQIRARQLQIADRYWSEDYMKKDKDRL